MPTYDYVCPVCGPFEARAAMADYQKPQPCPQCTSESARALLTVPGFAMMEAGSRRAHATNERARHEPLSTKKGHGSGCSCCSTGGGKKSSGTFYRPDGAKSFPAKRPWMISH